MFNFAVFKSTPGALALRIFALTITLSIVGVNIVSIDGQIERLKRGSIRDIRFENSESTDYAVITWVSSEAYEMGVSMGDIVLNPNANMDGEIGTPVTFLIKSGDAPAREVKFIQKSYNYPGHFITMLGLSPHARLYLGIILLWLSLIITGLFSVVAFWFSLDAWLAFLVTVAFSHLCALFSTNPAYAYFRLFLPSAIILFLVLFPNGKLNPSWSWLLVLWPLPDNVLVMLSMLGMFKLPQSMNFAYNIFLQYGPSFFLIILWGIVYWYRNTITPAERQRLNWLLFGVFFCVSPNWFREWIYSTLRLPQSVLNHFDSASVLQWSRVVYSAHIANFTLMPVWILVMGVVVYRYLRAFTAVERQQMKWLFFSLILITGPIIVSYMLSLYFSSSNLHNAALINSSFIDNLFGWELVIIAVFVCVSILRYRLEDVDSFINHALVYNGLIAMVGVIWLMASIFIDYTLGEITTRQKVFMVVPISIVLIVVSFKSVRFRLQAFADKYFKPDELDFAQVFFELTPEMLGLFALPELSEFLVAKSYKQFGVAYVSAFIENKNGKLKHIKTVLMSGKIPKLVIGSQELSKLKKGELVSDIDPAYSIIILLVLSRGENIDLIGALVLGPRLNGLGYSTNMKKSLIGFGQEAGKALYAARIRDQKLSLKQILQAN